MNEQELLEILYLFQRELREQACYEGKPPIEKIINIEGEPIYSANSRELEEAIKNAFNEIE